MLRRNKIETVGTISEFMSGEYKIRKQVDSVNRKLVKTGMKIAVTYIAGSLVLDFVTPTLAMASGCEQVSSATPVFAGEEKLKQTIRTAFDPIIKLIMDLSYPIAGVMITAGSLRYMIGQREQGLNLIQNAAIGYILVQLSPLMLDLLVGIGGSVA